MKEFDIHQQIIGAVDPHNTDARIQHIPNPRSFAEYRLGYKGGWPDIVITMPFGLYGVEVKKPKGWCTSKQVVGFIQLCLCANFKIYVVDNADDGIRIMHEIIAERSDFAIAKMARESFLATPHSYAATGKIESTFDFYYTWQGKSLPKCYRDALIANNHRIWKAAKISYVPYSHYFGEPQITWRTNDDIATIF